MTWPNAAKAAGLRRFAKSAALLDSPIKGERLAALEASNRFLAEAGLSWIDITSELPGTAIDEPPAGKNKPRHIAEAADLMQRGLGFLTPWETTFLIGVEGFSMLSGKQRITLDAIAAKLAAAA